MSLNDPKYCKKILGCPKIVNFIFGREGKMPIFYRGYQHTLE